MATILLGDADIALFSDPVNSVVPLRNLTTQTPAYKGEGAFVRFEGRRAPSGARGEGFSSIWSLEVVFESSEHDEAYSLQELLERAFHAGDGRLQLRTTGGNVAGLNPLVVCEVHNWTQPREAGGIIRMSFEATEVDYDLEV